MSRSWRYFACTIIAVCAALGTVGPASAQTIFSQNFESPLGGSESTGGTFSRNNTNALNNGTFMMGHPTDYGDSDYSFYQISGLALPAGTISMTFDYAASLETHFDRFNVLVATTGNISPPSGRLDPTGASDMQFIDLDHDHHANLGQFAYDSSGPAGGTSGVARFDLSAFAGQTVDIRFQFGADESVSDTGFNMDNLLISGASAVPEPATMTLAAAGLAGAVMTYRKRRKTRVSKR
jgi:hypothetical protein